MSEKRNFINSEKTLHQAELLSNRIKKRFSHLAKKYERQQIDCFRLYDWDIPEIRAVVDWYAGHIVIAEYIRQQTTPEWLPKMAEAVAQILNVPMEKVHIKQRRTAQEGEERYSKLSSKNQRIQVRERDLKFWVNLDDFLDTGLFSDHRETRTIIGKLASGKNFLNLYGYTGAFTCAAAANNAAYTVTVDRSATYLNWTQDNLQLNGLWGNHHSLVQLDVDEFLIKALQKEQRFNLAFVDPPSFFNLKGKNISFDVNRDHPDLLQSVCKVMERGSFVFFSSNHQRFEPQFKGLPIKELFELTPKTIPEDYHNQQIHRCWRMTVK